MSDPRLTPSNGRVAETGWEGRVDAQSFVPGIWKTVALPVTDLLRSPSGPRDRQLLLGDRFLVLETQNGWSFGRAEKDNYVGYVTSEELEAADAATHFVSARATHEYAVPDIKSIQIAALSFGSRIRVRQEHRQFVETDHGTFVPIPHVRPVDRLFRDPVPVAEIFLGTPYLWGGNSAFGIDCSGLVQAALLACGISCPGDSDLQCGVGDEIAGDAGVERGDLIFWEGHVALAVDSETLIHANAHHMAVAFEPVAATIQRIEAQGDGPVIARRRLAL